METKRLNGMDSTTAFFGAGTTSFESSCMVQCTQ